MDPAGLTDAKNPELIFFPDGILKSGRSFHFIAVFFLLLTNLILMRKKNHTGSRCFLRFFFSWVDKHENNSILFCSIYLILLTGYLLTYLRIYFIFWSILLVLAKKKQRRGAELTIRNAAGFCRASFPSGGLTWGAEPQRWPGRSLAGKKLQKTNL